MAGKPDLIGRYDAGTVSRVLHLLLDIDRSIDLEGSRTRRIATGRIVAIAWSPGRLQRAERLLAEGRKATPVHATRFILLGRTYYTLSDGNHRVVAARNAGHRTIAAHVGSETDLHPEHFVLDTRDNSLWEQCRSGPNQGWLRLVDSQLEEPVMQALADVGVPGRI